VGPTAVEAPMDELINQWTTQCADAAAIGCGAIGASIEVELVNLIRGLQRSGSVDRQTLFDAAHADFPLLTQLAMSLMYNAQTPEEVEFALKMTEHPAAGVREAARRMLQGSDDSRWKPIERWWKSTRGADGGGPASGLVPDLEPLARYFGVETLEGLRHRPFGSDERSVMFTTTEPADVVVKRLSKGKTVMTKQSDMKKDMESFEDAMMSMQKEMMAAAQSGDMDKIDKLTQKMMEMQEKLTGGDFAAINTDDDSEGILLEKDAKTGAPLSVARVKRDEEWGQTVVIIERNQPN